MNGETSLYMVECSGKNIVLSFQELKTTVFISSNVIK